MTKQEFWKIFIEVCTNHFGSVKDEDYIKMMYEVEIDELMPHCSDSDLIRFIDLAWQMNIDDYADFQGKWLYKLLGEYMRQVYYILNPEVKNRPVMYVYS